MNTGEVKKILKIMASADGGCIYCARELFFRFISEFPDFIDIAKDIFKRTFNEELESSDLKNLVK